MPVCEENVIVKYVGQSMQIKISILPARCYKQMFFFSACKCVAIIFCCFFFTYHDLAYDDLRLLFPTRKLWTNLPD